MASGQNINTEIQKNMAKNTKTTKKKVVRIDALGKAFVYASFNNVIVSLTNNDGQVISWSSAGKMGFRGSKKNTPYAAQMAAQDCAKVAYDLGMRRVKVYVKGPAVAASPLSVPSMPPASALKRSLT